MLIIPLFFNNRLICLSYGASRGYFKEQLRQALLLP